MGFDLFADAKIRIILEFATPLTFYYNFYRLPEVRVYIKTRRARGRKFEDWTGAPWA